MDDVRGRFLGLPNGTTPAVVTTNKRPNHYSRFFVNFCVYMVLKALLLIISDYKVISRIFVDNFAYSIAIKDSIEYQWNKYLTHFLHQIFSSVL